MDTQANYEVATRPDYGVINFEEYAMTGEGVVRQVNIIQNVMKGVMKIDEHYGTIPGTNKPSLYKPGAEKLSLVFRLRPEYDVRRSDLPGGHREYEVVCTLYHIPTGQSVGQGVGSATTMEGKYRYRGGEKITTDQPVPKEYWNLKNAGKTEEARILIGGMGYGVGKDDDGKWVICEIGEKMEHENPADYYNTILKMAKKRAHVDAILTATAASDIFTQDVEDMPEVIPGAAKQPAGKKPPVTPPQKKSDKKDPEKKEPRPPEEQLSVITPIANIESKEGVNPKTQKPYTIYAITDAKGVIYKGFDKKLVEIAEAAWADGKMINITYTVGQYGNNFINVEVVSGE